MRPITELHVATACDGCAESCCSQPYDWVHLTDDEVRALSSASGLAAEAFVTHKVNAATGFRFKILELPCRFYEQTTGRCTVYASRPLVCKIYPFHVDPLSGDGMLLAAQCGDRLDVLDRSSPVSWSLAQYGDTLREWLRALWREAQEHDETTGAAR